MCSVLEYKNQYIEDVSKFRAVFGDDALRILPGYDGVECSGERACLCPVDLDWLEQEAQVKIDYSDPLCFKVIDT